MKKTGPILIEEMSRAEVARLAAKMNAYIREDDLEEHDWFAGTIPRSDLTRGTVGHAGQFIRNYAFTRNAAAFWNRWGKQERENQREQFGYDRMGKQTKWWLKDPAVAPLIVSYDHGLSALGIFDGWHRAAIAVKAKLDRVPAVVGMIQPGKFGTPPHVRIALSTLFEP